MNVIYNQKRTTKIADMSWPNLEKKHQKEWEEFEILKAKAWDTLEKKRQSLYAAFGDQESNLFESVQEELENDRQNWQAVWGVDGEREKYLRELQHEERKELKAQVKQSILDQIRTAREQSKSRANELEHDD